MPLITENHGSPALGEHRNSSLLPFGFNREFDIFGSNDRLWEKRRGASESGKARVEHYYE